MGKFKANTDDAYILTNIQNQESGDSDWVQYQVITKDKSRLILHNDTTNDLLKVFKDTTQAHDIFNDGSAVATYPLDGNVNDLGGNYNGTWSGTEQYDTGVFGQAAKIVSSYIYNTNLKFGNQVKTVSLWFKDGVAISNEVTSDVSNRVSVYTSYDNTNQTLHIHSRSRDGACVSGDWRYRDVSIDNVNISKFHHLVFIFIDPNTYSLFFDGNSIDFTITSSNGLLDTPGQGFVLGRYDFNADIYYVDGLIDQVRIFNRALTEDEVAFLYHEDFANIRKHDQLIIYNATDGAKIHEITSITDNDTDKTYDIDISSLSLTEVPTNAHQLTKSVDLTDKIDTSNTTATTLILQDALENPTLVKNGETLVIDGYKLENINVTRSLDGGNIKYSVDISSLNLTQAPSEVVLIKPRVEISVGDQDKANADDLVLDVDTNNTTTTQIVTNYISINDSQRTRIKNAEKVDTDTGLDIQVINVTEEGDGGSPEKFKYTIELAETQSSAPTKAIIRPTIQDILELDQNNTAYDDTNDLVNIYYQPIQKGNGFRSVQVKWNAHKQGDENNSLRVNLWKKVV